MGCLSHMSCERPREGETVRFSNALQPRNPRAAPPCAHAPPPLAARFRHPNQQGGGAFKRRAHHLPHGTGAGALAADKDLPEAIWALASLKPRILLRWSEMTELSLSTAATTAAAGAALPIKTEYGQIQDLEKARGLGGGWDFGIHPL